MTTETLDITSITHIADRILLSATQMTVPERDALRSMLSMAVGRISPRGELPSDPKRAAALRSIVRCLADYYPWRDQIPSDGIAFRGRPPFLTDELLAALQKESAEVRARATRERGHWLGRGGTLANRLAGSQEMGEFVGRHTVPMTATHIASYLFYEGLGYGMEAHVDTEIFCINANLMLAHDFESERSSSFYMYLPDGEFSKIVLEPGELLLTYAGSTVHGRAPLAQGEVVRNLTIGFQPQALA